MTLNDKNQNDILNSELIEQNDIEFEGEPLDDTNWFFSGHAIEHSSPTGNHKTKTRHKFM